TVGQDIDLGAAKIGRAERAGTHQFLRDLLRQRNIGGASIEDEVDRRGAVNDGGDPIAPAAPVQCNRLGRRRAERERQPDEKREPPASPQAQRLHSAAFTMHWPLVRFWQFSMAAASAALLVGRVAPPQTL